MPKRWQREQEIAGQLLQNACAYTWFDLAFIEGDMVDGSKWSHDGMVDAFSAFLNERVEPKVQARA